MTENLQKFLMLVNQWMLFLSVKFTLQIKNFQIDKSREREREIFSVEKNKGHVT